MLLMLGVPFSNAHAADPAEPHHVTAVRFWSLGGVTRIAIETDGDFQVKSDRLDSPDRLFFDLSGTKPILSHKSMTVIPVADHFVKQIRVAEPQHNVTRVVLDLETAVEPTISRLDNPTRLIVELRASGSTPETTKAPARMPPTLVEPVLSPKTSPQTAPQPAEHRPFIPPPAAAPVVISAVQPKEAWLDPPPALQLRNTAMPVLPVNYKLTPAPGRSTVEGAGASLGAGSGVGVLAKRSIPTGTCSRSTT